MHFKRVVIALALASALGRAETGDPRIIARYKQMLEANPSEGIAVERLWKASMEDGSTEKLIAEFRAGKTFSSAMILGHLLRRSGENDDAVAAFDRAAKLDAASALPYLALAKLESDRTRPREAALALEKAGYLLKSDDPRLADTLLQLGAAWSAAGDAEKAAKAWERTVTTNPNDLALRRRLADSYAAGLLYAEAVAHLRFIAKHGPAAERATALAQAAKLHSAAGQPAEAMQALDEATAMTAPGNWLRTELNGQMIRLAQRQRIESALEDKWRKDAESNPRDLGAALRLVEYYERTGALQPQQQWLEKVIALTPKSHEYRLRLARVMGQLDNLDGSAAQLDQLLAAQPGDADLVFERARLDLQREDGAAARARISALLGARKTDDSLRAKALEFFQENHLLDLAEESLKADATTPESVQSLAAFYFGQKRDTEALATLGGLVRPTDPPLSRATAHFQIAQALKLQSLLSAAADQAAQAAKLAPDVRDYHVMLGEVLTSLGRGKEARPPLERAWELSQSDTERLEADQKIFASFRARALGPDEDPDFMPRRQDRTAAEVEEFIRVLMSRATTLNSAAGWLRVARWKAWNGDKGGAMTYATKAAGIEPKNPLPVEFMAQHAAANGDHSSASLNLRALVDLNPARRDVYLRQLAQLEALAGNGKEAARIFADIAARNPGSPDALADLAGMQERSSRLVDALDTWRKAHTLAPPQRKREFSASILRVLQRQGKHEEASDLLLRLVDETPDEKEKFARFDELLLHAQQHNQLAWLRERLLQRRKARADDYFTAMSLGRVLKLIGEKAAAFDLFADAVFSAPNQEQALPELIREAEELRRLDTAIRLQEQLTRVVNQERPDGFLKLAALQEKTGDLAGAERSWGRATAKFPRDFEVLRRAADFHLAWGDTKRATMLLRKLSVLEPSYLRGAVELGVMEAKSGNAQLAKDAFESVLKLSKPIANLTLFPTRTDESPWAERVSFERGTTGTGAIFSSGTRTDIRHAWMSEELVAISPSRARMESPERPARIFAPARSGAAMARLEPGAEWRLLAIRGAAEAARSIGGKSLEAWTRDWLESAKVTPNETLWALFFAGENTRVLDLMENAMRENPGDLPLVQAYVSMALESDQLERLSRWLEHEERYGLERLVFTVAFAEMTQKRESFPQSSVARLFPPQATARLWTSGVQLALQRAHEPALLLGVRAVERFTSDRAAAFREMARWELPSGRIAESRRWLENAAAEKADSFESGALAALQELYFLLPPEERPAFTRGELEKLKGDGIQEQLRRTLLLHLDGRQADSLAELHRVLDRHPMSPLQPGADHTNSTHRELLWLSGAADAFVQWDMPDLAAGVWARSLSDPGLVTLKGRLLVRDRVEGSRNGMWVRGDSVEDIFEAAANQLDALRFAMGGPVERAEILADRARRSAHSGHPQSGKVLADPEDRDEPFLSLADALRTLQAWPCAVEVCLRAWETNTESPRVLRELLDACQRAGDDVTAEHVRRRCVEDHINPGNDSTLRQFAIDLADLLERRGAVDEAQRMISGALDGSPGDFSLLRRQAQLFQRAGRTEDAENSLRRLSKMDGGSAVARGQLAALLEQRGKLAESLDVRLRGGGFDARAPVLLFKYGRLDEGISMLEKFSGISAVEPAADLAFAMAIAGDIDGARSVLVSLASRIGDPRAQFSLRAKLLALPGARPSAEFVSRMKERMLALSEFRPELQDRYYEFFQQNAGRLGIAESWTAELKTSSALGAKFALIENQPDVAEKTIAEILTHATSQRFPFAGLLETLGKTALAVPVAKRAVELTSPLPAPLQGYVRLLDGLGRREDARNALIQYEWTSSFTGNAAVLGRLWLDVGEPERARVHFQAALKDRPLSSQSPALAGMAQVQAVTGNREAANILLRRAFSQPSFRDFGPLVDVLSRAGELNRWNTVAEELGVRPELFHELKTAIFAHYEKNGRTAEALAWITAAPEIIAPVNEERLNSITFARIRAMARTTGEFKTAVAAFDALQGSTAPDIEPELAMLHADWCIARGENSAATPYLSSAAALRPGNWEYVRRASRAHLSEGRKNAALSLLEAFLGVPQPPAQRDAAIGLWEEAKRAPEKKD